MTTYDTWLASEAEDYVRPDGESEFQEAVDRWEPLFESFGVSEAYVCENRFYSLYIHLEWIVGDDELFESVYEFEERMEVLNEQIEEDDSLA